MINIFEVKNTVLTFDPLRNAPQINTLYGRHWISVCVQIVALIPKKHSCHLLYVTCHLPCLDYFPSYVGSNCTYVKASRALLPGELDGTTETQQTHGHFDL